MTKQGTKILILAIGTFSLILGLFSALSTVIFDQMLVMLIIGVTLILLGAYCFYQVKKGNYQAVEIKQEKPDDSDW